MTISTATHHHVRVFDAAGAALVREYRVRYLSDAEAEARIEAECAQAHGLKLVVKVEGCTAGCLGPEPPPGPKYGRPAS